MYDKRTLNMSSSRKRKHQYTTMIIKRAKIVVKDITIIAITITQGAYSSETKSC